MSGATPLFLLREYEMATLGFVGDAVREIAIARSPVLRMLRHETREDVHAVQVTKDTGDVLRQDPMEVSAEYELRFEDVLAGNVDGFVMSMDAASVGMAETLTRAVLSRLAEFCRATGMVSNEAGGLTWGGALRMLEKMEIDFNDDGSPDLPTLVISEEGARQLGEASADDVLAFEDLIRRKREEYRARRRNRTLP